MSITIVDNPTFTAPVTAHQPGQAEPTTFNMVYKALDHDELESLRGEVDGKKLTNQEIIEKVVAGFGDDVLDKDGNQLPFSLENLRKVSAIYPFRPAIVMGFYAALNPEKEKN